MKEICVAVVGTGFIGPVHVEALRRLGIRVKGILGSSPEKSKKAAATLGLPAAYCDYAELLGDKEVGSVHIASPNRVHCAQVLAALDAGKHVVCEKPLGMTSSETAELVEASRRHPDLVAAVNYNVRFYPLCLHARGLIRRGEIGRIFHLHCSYVQDWLLYPSDFNWRVMAEEGGELRAIGDIGTHWLDLLGFISGLEIEAVMADLATAHPVRQRPPSGSGSVETFTGQKPKPAQQSAPVAISTDDYGSVLLRFRGGQRGVFTVSQVTAGRKNCIRYEIAGAEKSLAWDNEGFPDTFKQQYRAIYADVRNGHRSPDPLYATFADGHRELLLCEAILKSHRAGTWVKVD
jgi:predicted dehydrogenase